MIVRGGAVVQVIISVCHYQCRSFGSLPLVVHADDQEVALLSFAALATTSVPELVT